MTNKFQRYLFKVIYPFGFINIYLIELTSLALGSLQGIKIDTSTVACSFHLIYILIKNCSDIFSDIIAKKELFGCFIFVAISMYINALKHVNFENLKSSEWIFLFFKHLFSESPSIFRDLYFYNHSEDSTIECDASLIYLTMQEPFVKLSMLRYNNTNISDAKITREILILQKLISNTIITEYEFRDILLEICVELETNPNFKQDKKENTERNIINQIVILDGIFETILSEFQQGISYFNQFTSSYIGYHSLGLKDKNPTKFSISKFGNTKGWVSVLRISIPIDESNVHLFEKALISLTDLLRDILKFRNHLIKSNYIINEETRTTWKLVSEEISISSVIQAISSICYGNTKLQDTFSLIQDGKLLK